MKVDTILHVLVRALIRLRPLPQVHALMAGIAQWLEPHVTIAGLREAADGLAGRGTCLSRAVTVGCRSPGSELVIGVLRGKDGSFTAHAWLELDGNPLHDDDPRGEEIARLPHPHSHRAPRHADAPRVQDMLLRAKFNR